MAIVNKKQGGAAASGLKHILKRAAVRRAARPLRGVPVYVGERRRRFVVPIAMLDRPEFRSLLRRAEEEFGFAGAGGAGGALVLPCEEVAFRSLTSALACAR
ncbi:Auxin-responsive protein SAUR50 [Zea mays]|uniref:Auxin-responsive protein SAUR50 n=1 Tax=Zea mays TaxID=4577 RepID=A0A3L6DG78_MAIZE|nr:Auxin-responsive protein SAUR50 [Zea mays]